MVSEQNSKFAPTGYGLGENTTETVDLNEETVCGWKAFTKASLNTPFDYGLVLTMNRYGNQITQIAFNPYMGGCGEICIRHKYDDVWREWEYLNPPMLLGVEYRTTERWQGKPVYTKSVDCGEVTDGKVINVGVRRIISSNCVVVGDTYEQTIPLLPFKTNASSLDTYGVGYIVNGNQITLVAGTGVSNLTAITAIKYTKD